MIIRKYKYGIIRLISLLTFILMLAYGSLVLFDSMLIALMLFLTLIGLPILKVIRSRKAFREVADKFYSRNFEKHHYKPSISDFDKDWVLGSAHAGYVRNATFVKVDKRGVICQFCCYMTKNPIVIDWGSINKIELGKLHYTRVKSEMAKIMLDFDPYYIFLPWREDFTESIPEAVSIQQAGSWKTIVD